MLGLLALLTLACAVGTGGGDGSPPAPPPPGRTAPDSQAADDFQDDLEGAVQVAEAYWSDRFEAAGARFTPVSRILPYRSDGEVSCAGEPVPRNNAVYCSDGDFIAYDVNFAVTAFERIGDAFLYYLLGHEYAHGVQVRLGIQYRFTIEQELQADCMAGAYIGDSVRAGSLTLEDGDIQELRDGLTAVGDDPSIPWFTPGAHGTAQQRLNAFASGYNGSLGPCGLRL